MKLRSYKILLALLALALCGLPASRVLAQGLTLDVINGVPSAIPITVVPFGFESAAQPPATDVAAVIRDDMVRCGKFRTLTGADIVEHPSHGGEINFSTWKLLKQDYLVIGRERDAGNGQIRVEYELWNVTAQKKMLAGAYTALPEELRGVAHQIADQIYQKIIGQPGAFYTRIAYVTTTGSGKAMQWSLIVADSDGHNPQIVVRSRLPLLSPAWSPNGKELAYVSLESGDSAIYLQNLASGQRRLISGRKGINGAPAFSPDGKKLAMMLSFGGSPEIYIEDLASGQLTQITHNPSINSGPRWMPDGKSLIFMSDRSGKPQLYQESITGGGATRLTFDGEYNSSAAINYDASQLAMMHSDDSNTYRIAIMDRKLDNQLRFISPGPLDESPSFAPNGSMLLYAATDPNGKGVLYEVADNGSVRQRLALVDGNVQSPAWGPYRIPTSAQP
ncbi:Tol-Pal system beta propeller repeat protein TolB [Metallibacterium sp.]|uniref:Tol-Pal system beta propeller repeat protein TolB n=1 Tax=Metallibacterium sp. TaxID=2940281 RepID=UPI002636D6CF|nr:Tol-Pal system beta propeller repeat protein TolB [Metallibacterium sp.]